jgi:hypothetical protein
MGFGAGLLAPTGSAHAAETPGCVSYYDYWEVEHWDLELARIEVVGEPEAEVPAIEAERWSESATIDYVDTTNSLTEPDGEYHFQTPDLVLVF